MNASTFQVQSAPVEIKYDRGRDWRARIGYVLIATAGVIEGEMISRQA